MIVRFTLPATRGFLLPLLSLSLLSRLFAAKEKLLDQGIFVWTGHENVQKTNDPPKFIPKKLTLYSRRLMFFFMYRGFSRWPCWRAETVKQFCMKIDLISQGRENVLFLPSNMAEMTSNENALYSTILKEEVPV